MVSIHLKKWPQEKGEILPSFTLSATCYNLKHRRPGSVEVTPQGNGHVFRHEISLEANFLPGRGHKLARVADGCPIGSVVNVPGELPASGWRAMS